MDNNQFHNQQQNQQDRQQQQQGQQQGYQQQNYYQSYNNPYGTYYGQAPYGQPPYSQQGYYGYSPFDPRMVEAKSKASNAQTFGIIALIGLFVGAILSIIFGILAMNSAKKSTQILGYELSEAKTGRVMGLVSLILAIIGCVAMVLIFIFYFILFALAI